MNTRKFERRGLIITETLMVLLAVLWAVPIYYLIVTTLKSPAEATASPLALPSTINLQNYIDAWQCKGHFESRFIANSNIKA